MASLARAVPSLARNVLKPSDLPSNIIIINSFIERLFFNSLARTAASKLGGTNLRRISLIKFTKDFPYKIYKRDFLYKLGGMNLYGISLIKFRKNFLYKRKYLTLLSLARTVPSLARAVTSLARTVPKPSGL